MFRFPTINFLLSTISKLLVKHISTKDSFEIVIRKRHVYIDIGWPWIWNQCFYLGIWNDNRTKMIVLPSFDRATRLKSQNTNETKNINEILNINLFRNIGISNGILRVSTSNKWCFLLYFSSLHYYWPPSTWNPLLHTSWCKWNDVKNVLFSSSKCEKRKSAET